MIQLLRKMMSDWRYNYIKPFIKGKSLDVGAEWKRPMFDECCDANSKEVGNIKDIHNLTYKDNQFDTVCCLEVLEHTENPVKAMKELKRVANKRIIISVPFEPYFTLPRIVIGWNKEHLWAITPDALLHHLGRPTHEKHFRFRWYIGVWDYR